MIGSPRVLYDNVAIFDWLKDSTKQRCRVIEAVFELERERERNETNVTHSSTDYRIYRHHFSGNFFFFFFFKWGFIHLLINNRNIFNIQRENFFK